MTNHTQILAKHIANYLKADQYHIVGDNKYPTKYMDIIKQAQTELNKSFRPKLVNPLNSIEQYDTIFIGYPIWYSKPPMAVYTFSKVSISPIKMCIYFALMKVVAKRGLSLILKMCWIKRMYLRMDLRWKELRLEIRMRNKPLKLGSKNWNFN